MITKAEQQIIAKAIAIIEREALTSDFISNQENAANFLRLQFGNLEHEVFAIIYLTAQLQVINHEVLFRGTIDGAAVYPREVLKGALNANAASVMLCHNHPSGLAAPSEADKFITRKLFEALSVAEIKVIDHVIVTNKDHYSFAANGLL